MPLSERLRLGSITTQITGIVAISVLLGVVLTVTTVLFFGEGRASNASPSAAALRIEQIAQLVMAAANPSERRGIVAAARRSGMKVELVPLSNLEPASDVHELPVLSAFIRRLALGADVDVIDSIHAPAGPDNQLVVRIDGQTALVFDLALETNIWRFIWAPTALTVATILVFVIFLSVYAVRWIIAPLSEVAAAATSFGRSSDGDQVITPQGPREIAQVANALNEMRTRIRGLLDDRTRMLAAISHDLRTPLTRLRLRAERIADQILRDGILHEIAQVSLMLDETLNYLRQDSRSEEMSRVDLPSMLQTIATDFSDVGHNVSYSGPTRLTLVCRQSALTRAVSNVVANAVKHGSTVLIELRGGKSQVAQIDVSDDGPGIAAAARDKVFEPFFKADDARTAIGGFGLGLSIARDVVKSHGGDIELLDRLPHGLTVRIRLLATGTEREL